MSETRPESTQPDSAAKPTPPPPPQKRSIRRFWPIIPLGLILIALMLEDLHVMGWSAFEADSCGVAELDQSSLSAKLYAPLARWAVHSAGVPRVAIVYISADVEPAELLTNTCASRLFIARLVPDLNALGAGAIVIDKYYSHDACAEAATNDLFESALEASPVPVVVGRPTHVLSDSSKLDGCIGLSQGFAFKPSNVSVGLTRLNTNPLKIPLHWPVYDDTTNPKSPSAAADADSTSLSLAAAKAAWPTIESMGQMPARLKAGTHPYTTFIDPPNIHAMNVICAAEPHPAPFDKIDMSALCNTPGWTPKNKTNIDGQGLNLSGKIVVVGDFSDLDMQPFPTQPQNQVVPSSNGQVPGVYLQANYVESLLDQRFLTETPTWVTVTFLIIFVLGIYCLYWAHDANQIPLLTPEKALLGSLALLAVMMLLCIVALLTINYFTPVWAIWGAGFFLAFRYLETSGHHRSQHLLGELMGHGHHPETHQLLAVSNPSTPLAGPKDEDAKPKE
jgi:CHASE2 domain-containing sensor protein